MATVQGAAKPPCGTNERQVAKVAKGVMGNISASSRSLSEIGCMQRRKERREDAKAGQEKMLLLGGLGVLAFIFFVTIHFSLRTIHLPLNGYDRCVLVVGTGFPAIFKTNF